MDKERRMRKTRVGVVISDKMDKTVVVSVERTVRHPLYDKVQRRTVTFKAHDREQRVLRRRSRTHYGDQAFE